MKLFLASILLFSSLAATDYTLGYGYKINDNIHIGGYFSTDYTFSNNNSEFRLDDVAIMSYGKLSSNISYLFELEAAPFYVKNFINDYSQVNAKFHYERVYIDYMYSNNINIRLGKQISPIGYWNIEPINVLRDTSSNPLYSYKMFPKLFTGIDFYGFINDESTLTYHLFIQNNKDLDEEYINIKNDLFLGLTLHYEITNNIDFGTSIAQFKPKEKNKQVTMIECNTRYDAYPWLLQMELAYNDVQYNTNNQTSHQTSGYFQSMYNINDKHALIGRFEYFEDTALNVEDTIAIMAYSYRPKYSISIKTEYQIHSESTNNKAIISFSVLF